MILSIFIYLYKGIKKSLKTIKICQKMSFILIDFSFKFKLGFSSLDKSASGHNSRVFFFYYFTFHFVD